MVAASAITVRAQGVTPDQPQQPTPEAPVVPQQPAHSAPPAEPGAANAEASESSVPAESAEPVQAPAAPAPIPEPQPPAPPSAGSTEKNAAAASAAKPATEPSAKAASEADPLASLLADAGYPLTPGVSADPVKQDLVVSGYLQGQYESHQDSEDQLRQGGALLNQNRFVLRRGRIRVTKDWDYAQVIVEIDGNTVRGPAMKLQKAEASLIYGRSKDKDQPPIAQLTLGQFDLPFGFEVPYSPKVRWFMERTAGSRALFPSEPDMGLRFSGGLGFARYSVAVTNGEPLDEKSGLQLQDPNTNKDVTARLGVEAKASPEVVVAGGVSFNRGKGFHPGTDATKDLVQFADANQNGVVDSGDVQGLQGQAAERSKNFSRWAMGADAELLVKTPLGWTMFYGELVAASNLDRGLFIADPVLNSSALRELSYYLALTQEITEYGVVGFRYDYYNPNADLLDQRAGKLVPVAQHVRTLAPLVGLTLRGRARLLFEWDIVDDLLARDSRGVPTDFKNNQWTVRLQGMM